MVNTSLIPAPPMQDNLLYKNGNTNDIIKGILTHDKYLGKGLKQFAEQFRRDTDELTCKEIWTFLKYRITYKTDPEGIQYLQSPARLWKTKRGDCKSKSMYTAGLLQCLGIRYRYRFTTYTPGSNIATHVYVVATDKFGKDIIIDTVFDRFNAEKHPTFTKDIRPPMARIYYLNGIGNTDYSRPGSARDAEVANLSGIGRINFKKFAKGFLKVVTAPQRLAVKAALEVMLPKAAPAFLYLFIKDKALLAKLPPKLKNKYNKTSRIAKFITGTIGMKEGHFMNILRKGIKKKYKQEPEKLLAAQFGNKKVSGYDDAEIGFIADAALAVGALSKLIEIIAKAFKKKAPEDVSASDMPGTEDVGDVSPEVRKELANQRVSTSGELDVEKQFGEGGSNKTLIYVAGAAVVAAGIYYATQQNGK